MCCHRLTVLTIGGSNDNLASDYLDRATKMLSGRRTGEQSNSVKGIEVLNKTQFAPGKRTFIRFPPDMTFLEALATCETFACIREAHLLPKGEAKFNFPQFMIAGYSKSATTSLFRYLNTHPSTMHPKKKEPALFTNRCMYIGHKIWCPPHRVREYIIEILKVQKFVENSGSTAHYEATPRIFDLGPDMAEILYDLMPWLKIVASLREPISRSISKYVMFKEKFGRGCFVNNTLVECLLNDDERFYGNPKRKYYSLPLSYWVDHFPVDQLHLIQYEDLIGERQNEELQKVKEFIGLDPKLTPNELDFGLANCRHCRIHPEGWPMTEKDYKKLIKRVTPDVEEYVDSHMMLNMFMIIRIINQSFESSVLKTSIMLMLMY